MPNENNQNWDKVWESGDTISTDWLNAVVEQLRILSTDSISQFDEEKNGLVPGPIQEEINNNTFLNSNGSWETANDVQQNAPINIDEDYSILIKGSSSTASYIGPINTASGVTINPSTNTITATSFVGQISGSSITSGISTTVLPQATGENKGIVSAGTGLIANNGQLSVITPLPIVTAENKGSFLRVNSSGIWSVSDIKLATSAVKY